METKTIVLFGLSGHGKSSIANMLVYGNIPNDPKNIFPVNDSAIGEDIGDIGIQCALSEIGNYVVYDTAGLGETDSSKYPHNDVVRKLRSYFSETQISLNYICYIKKQGRNQNEDIRAFEIFKEIFKGGERNFIIIITHSSQEWVNENKKALKKVFGNYDYIKFIGVDFPFDRNSDNESMRIQRETSKNHLLSNLSFLDYKGISVMNNSLFQLREEGVAKVVSLVPVVGTTYNIIASGIYYAVGKPTTAKKRISDGSKSLLSDLALIPLINILKRVTERNVEDGSKIIFNCDIRIREIMVIPTFWLNQESLEWFKAPKTSPPSMETLNKYNEKSLCCLLT
ncbi:76_t:CDS:2 [Acaulospora morrowiae]|uniref:76_t:CDS:1 n=1 Tax=Acaulospora morrowiae TaxID=94023 RepID=A0A9N8V936_9GLOM|nr:76_t:CDS:2 [Acaulospora morrowiae]